MHVFLRVLISYTGLLTPKRNPKNMCNNIPAYPAYGIYISQLIKYAGVSTINVDLKKNRHRDT